MALTYRPYRLLKADSRSYTSGVGLGQTGDDPNLAFTLREEAAQRERAKLEAQLAQEQMRQAGETGRNADKLVAGNVEQQNDLQFRGWDAHQSRLRSLAQQMAEYGFRSKESADSRAQAEKMARLTDELHRGQMGLGQQFARENAATTRDFELEKLGLNQDQAQYMAYLNDGFQSERDERTAKRQKDFFDYQTERYGAKADEQYAQQQYMAQLGHANKLIESGRATRPPGWDQQMLRWQAALGDLDERDDLSQDQKEQSRKDLHGKMSRALLNIVPQAPGQWGKPMDEAVQEQVYWDGGKWGQGTPWVRDPKTGQPVIPRGWKPESQADAKGPTRKDVLDHAVKLYNMVETTVDGNGDEKKSRLFKTIDDAVRQAEIDYGISERTPSGSPQQETRQQGGLDPAIVEAARQARQLPMGQGGESEPWPRQNVESGVDPQALVDEAAAIDQEQARLVAAGERPSDEVLARMGAAMNRGPAPAVNEGDVFQQQRAARRPASDPWSMAAQSIPEAAARLRGDGQAPATQQKKLPTLDDISRDVASSFSSVPADSRDIQWATTFVNSVQKNQELLLNPEMRALAKEASRILRNAK